MGRKVMGAVENYLESCADIKVDIDALARFVEPEDEGVCLRYILTYSTRGGSHFFQSFLIHARKRINSWRIEGVGWSTQEEGASTHWRWPNEWRDLQYQGAVAKASAVPRQHLTDAPASAKLVVTCRRRRSLGLDGRLAKAKDCLREAI